MSGNLMKNWLSKSSPSSAASNSASSSAAAASKKPPTESAKSSKSTGDDSPPKKNSAESQVVKKEKTQKKSPVVEADVASEKKSTASTSHKSTKKRTVLDSESDDADEAPATSKKGSKNDDTKKNKAGASSTTAATSSTAKATAVSKTPDAKTAASKKSAKPTTPEEEPKSAKKTATGGNKFFAAYMRREGPKNPGSKRIPIGKKDCFLGLKFLLTGVMDSLDREECTNIIKKYGGSIISGVTKKLDYLIVGEDAGESKLSKARELNVKQVNEDQFLQLICDKSGIKQPKYEDEENIALDVDEMKMEVEEKKRVEEKKPSPEKKQQQQQPAKSKLNKYLDESFDLDDDISAPPLAKKLAEVKIEKSSQPAVATTTTTTTVTKAQPLVTPKVESATPSSSMPSSSSSSSSSSAANSTVACQLWVEKYKPLSMAKIVGQGGEKSNANKLFQWLKNWQKWHGGDKATSAKKPWNDQDTGSSFKAALLSGPPGIGKTTTAGLVCKEAGYTFIELNASDSRSKKLLDRVLGESAESCSLDSFVTYGEQTYRHKQQQNEKHCIVMDEVDGMAGNEDRGGILELINTIKHSRIPIICICNDRQHVKIRSLANHCFDLRFFKPRIEQVRAALMSVCFKEGIKAAPDVIDQIIVGCNYDIRQCLNNLSMWSSNNKVFAANAATTSDIGKAMKDIRMNPFEACKQVFQADQLSSSGVGDKKPRTMMDKMEFFFADYSLMPLLVQENYLSVRPTELRGNTKSRRDLDHLERAYESVESMCHSDRVGRLIRTNNNWSLLTTQAIFATVVPGDKLSGTMGLAAFPSWFGKNSKCQRVDRILQELQKHMRIHISANKIGVGMDYLSVLKDMLSKPLIRRGADGIKQVINTMNEYSLTRDDFDTILELSTWPGQKDPSTLIDSKVKASFTRTFNKEARMNPFSIVNVKKLKGAKAGDEMGVDGGEDGDENSDDDDDDEKKDDVTLDAMIKVKAAKKPTAKAAASQAAKSSSAAGGGVKRSNTSEATSESSVASKKKKTK